MQRVVAPRHKYSADVEAPDLRVFDLNGRRRPNTLADNSVDPGRKYITLLRALKRDPFNPRFIIYSDEDYAAARVGKCHKSLKNLLDRRRIVELQAALKLNAQSLSKSKGFINRGSVHLAENEILAEERDS